VTSVVDLFRHRSKSRTRYPGLAGMQECADNGWIAVHGLPNIDSFVYVVKDRYGKKIREERRLYSNFEYLALEQGKSARLMNLCSQRLEDICHHFRSGAGALWEIPHDIGDIYLNQLVREGPGRSVRYQNGKHGSQMARGHQKPAQLGLRDIPDQCGFGCRADRRIELTRRAVYGVRKI